MRKVICAGLLLVSLLCGQVATQPQSTLDQKINDLATQLTKFLTDNPKLKIAVVGFTNRDGCFERFREFLQNELPGELLASRRFTVVSREVIDKIIEEQKLVLTGVFDPAAAKNLGQLLGADALVTGTIFDPGSDQPVRINAGCYLVRTGELISTAKVDIPKFEQIKSLMRSDGNCGEEPQDKPPPTREDEKVVPGSIAVRLLKCRRDSNIVVCEMRLTNRDRTNSVGRVRFSGGALLDESSNKALLKQVFKFGKSSPSFEIVSGGSVDVELRFQGISMDSKLAKVIQIVINSSTVTYSNICLVGFC